MARDQCLCVCAFSYNVRSVGGFIRFWEFLRNWGFIRFGEFIWIEGFIRFWIQPDSARDNVNNALAYVIKLCKRGSDGIVANLPGWLIMTIMVDDVTDEAFAN